MQRKLHCKNNVTLAYHQISGKSPGIIFLTGFMSDMSGTKALYFEKVCQEIGQSYIRFDYQGHGASSGKFEEATIGQWKQDVIEILDNVALGPQILVGSSLGGWLMVLAALEKPERIAGLLGIASAPDFTEDLYDKLAPEQQKAIENQGVCYIPNAFSDKPYAITKKLIEDGKKHHILDKSIPLHCPIRLIHGSNDTHVSWQQSLRLMNAVESKDTWLTLIKDGDHSLSSPEHLSVLSQHLKDLISDCF